MTKHLLPVKIDRGDGPAVVLLHGLGNNHKSWSYVLKHLDDSVAFYDYARNYFSTKC